MKPLRLELEGFARFAEPQVISFEDLNLFAIAGPTGAGKTLILDAICFALYGVTPRLSQRLESLISSGRDRLVVDLQFEVHSGTYRAVRSIERKASGSTSKSTRIERLLDAKWRLVPETEKLKEADQKLQQLVGFDFRAFTRSILLPQGKFDEFLHGDARQRRSLLKELLDLTRVEEMREEAGKRERAEAVRLEGIAARLSSGELEQAPATLRELKRERSELENELATVATQLTTGREQLRLAQEAAALHQELADLEPVLQKQLQAQSQAPALRKELEQGRLAAALLPLLASVERLQQRQDAAVLELRRLEEQEPELEATAARAREAAAAAREALTEAEPGLSGRIAELQQLKPLARRLRQLGGAPPGVTAGADDWDEERLAELQGLRARLRGLAGAESRSARAEGRLERLAAELAAAENELATGTTRLAGLLEEGKAAAQQVEELEEQVARHELAGGDSAMALRHALKEGEPCPVCQQPVAELPGETGHELTGLRSGLEAARARRQQLRDEYQEIRGVTARLEARVSSLLENRQEATASLAAERTELAELMAEFAAAGLHGTAEAMGNQVERATHTVLAAGEAKVRQVTGGAEPAEAIQEAEARLEELRLAERRTAAASTEAAHSLTRLQEHLAHRRQDHAAGHEALAGQRLSLDEQLQNAGFGSDAELREASRDQARLGDLEQLLEGASRELARLQEREKEIRQQLAGRADPRPQLAELSAALGEREAHHSRLLERRGSLQAEIVSQQACLDELGALLKERREREDTREVWKLLARDLQDHNFTDYLLAGMQQRLARQASSIIRQVTDDRFDLHLSANREFEVSDAWAGGERRSVKSLSGGETFIVSLALALALSDTAAGGRRLGALFLDEGFGTLDAVTLDSVAGVLESLSSDGRMVGIITHVPELSERLPARLLVSKDAEGSTAYWED